MNRPRGFALMVVIFTLVISSLIVVYLNRLAVFQASTVTLDIQGERAYYAARSGLEWGRGRAANLGSCNITLPPQYLTFDRPGLEGFGAKVTISCRAYGGREVFHIVSEGYYGTSPEALRSSLDYAYRYLEIWES